MSPKRQSLAGMLPDSPVEAPAIPVRAPTLPPEVQAPVQQTPEVSRSVPTFVAHRLPKSATPELPKYLRLERKELLAWPDDLTRLSVLARALNKSHGGRGERITANTLIRVAIASLLSRAGELSGDTEDELRRSLGLPG